MSMRILSYLLIDLLILLNFAHVRAADKDMVYIDVEYIVSKSTAAKQAKDIIKKEVDQFQAATKEKQDIISKQEQELQAKAKVLSSDALKQEQEKIVKQFKTFEAELAEKKQKLDKTYGDFLSELQSHIQRIVIELSEKNGYKIVMTRNSLVYAVQSLDISDDVVLLLNKKVPSITLNLDKK
jgi:outer membrane protein